MRPEPPLHSGIKIIQFYQKTLGDKPGVYRMLDAAGKVLYVGKAKNLSKRVISYTRPEKLPMRLRRMISETRAMEFIETHTELEALLLEFNMIKELKPVYNILLKDDKAYPYIVVTRDHDYPRLIKHRGKRTLKGDYYGPFASAGAVGRTMETIQKIFQIRNCTDSYFATRKRPCLQYHIKRCTAPCVAYVTQEDYNAQVNNVTDFLSGHSQALQKQFADEMRQAADKQNFERAAWYRDRIKALAAIQSTQMINLTSDTDADVIALVHDAGMIGLSVFFIRNGQNFGNQTYFPKVDEDESAEDIMSRFLIDFYTRHPVVAEIWVSHMATDHSLLAEALSAHAGKTVYVTKPVRGSKAKILDMAIKNAAGALQRHKMERSSDQATLAQIAKVFDMNNLPQRIEVYDNSHTAGDAMLGAMIVATPDGFQKSHYRKFNLKETDASDDYGAMREVMKRRFGRALEEGKAKGDDTWPDLILIDGGKGQLSAVTEILQELGIADDMTVVAIAKGPDRNAGREDFYMNGRAPFRLPPNDAGLFYLQRLRDEAHRFAIGSMRARRTRTIEKSPLDDVAGIGPKRKKALLAHFGSGKAVAGAALADLQKVEGISKSFAEVIYNHFHGE